MNLDNYSILTLIASVTTSIVILSWCYSLCRACAQDFDLRKKLGSLMLERLKEGENYEAERISNLRTNIEQYWTVREQLKRSIPFSWTKSHKLNLELYEKFIERERIETTRPQDEPITRSQNEPTTRSQENAPTGRTNNRG